MKRKKITAKNYRSQNVPAVSAKQSTVDTTAATADKENRKHKDSVFVDLFYEDETAEKNLLSLYNALYGTHYRSGKKIRKIRVENVLYKNFKNDISFEVDHKVIIFGEHQSSVNKNMPLRCLMYSGRAYEQLVDKRARYQKRLVKIPTPEFFTFYNGMDEFPLEEELCLSDSFLNPTGNNPLELTVKVININSDKAHPILKKCRVLNEYSLFIDTIRKYEKEVDSIKKAINECIANGILEDYLKRKGSEVTNMLIAEYDYEEDMQVCKEEAREEAIEELWEETRKEVEAAETKAKTAKLTERISLIQKKCAKNKPLSVIADDLETEPDEIRPLYDLISTNPERSAEEICSLIVR